MGVSLLKWVVRRRNVGVRTLQVDIPYFFHAAPREQAVISTYLVEVSAPRPGDAALEHATARARAAAEQITAEGIIVRHLGSFLAPSDGASFHLFESESADAVARAAELAEFDVERVVEGVT